MPAVGSVPQAVYGQVTMSKGRDSIRIIGARENNLKDVTLEIPEHQITVFTGVSGAGKSSLAFDTIAAEARCQLNAAFTHYLPLAGRPDADAIENLSPAVIIDHKQIRGNTRSTVGTITQIFSLLRLLYSRVGEPHVGYSNAFSSNDPEGMCPACDRLGATLGLDQEKLLDRERSIAEGAIDLSSFDQQWRRYGELGLFDSDHKLADYTDAEWEMLLHGDTLVEIPTTAGLAKLHYEGLVDRFARLYIQRDVSALSQRRVEDVNRVMSRGVCPLCKGARLSREALSSKIRGYKIAQLASMEVTDLTELVRAIKHDAATPIVMSIVDGLEDLICIGLGYLTLDRETTSLSGGEAQRIKMVRHLGSSLTDLIYIFDEPTMGLHPRDVRGLNQLLRKLRDQGNTVLVVEHDPDVIAIADYVADLGPGAGTDGGQIVYQGSLEGLVEADTLTGRHLRRRPRLKV